MRGDPGEACELTHPPCVGSHSLGRALGPPARFRAKGPGARFLLPLLVDRPWSPDVALLSSRRVHAMTASLLAGALAAGLVGSPHCVGMCGGFASAASDSRLGSAPWHAGRLMTYAALGAAAGGLGATLPGPRWLPVVLSTLFLAWFALRLAGWSPVVSSSGAHRLAALARRAIALGGWPGRVAFGAVSGLLPCGLVYAALALPVASGSAAAGALAMLVFGLGTVPALSLAGAGVRRLAGRSIWARRGLALLIFLCGAGAIFWRSPLLSSGADGAPPCHATHDGDWSTP